MQNESPQRESSDERIGRITSQHPTTVAQSRAIYNADPIIHAILVERIETLVVENQRKLESAPHDEVKAIQGELRALRKAIACINQKE